MREHPYRTPAVIPVAPRRPWWRRLLCRVGRHAWGPWPAVPTWTDREYGTAEFFRECRACGHRCDRLRTRADREADRRAFNSRVQDWLPENPHRWCVRDLATGRPLPWSVWDVPQPTPPPSDGKGSPQ